MLCTLFNSNFCTTIISCQCQWWNRHHHLLKWVILPCMRHFQTHSNHQWRHECSNWQKQKWQILLTQLVKQKWEYLTDFSLKNRLPCLNHHYVAPSVQISLALSCHPSILSIAPSRSSRLYLVLAQSCCI